LNNKNDYKNERLEEFLKVMNKFEIIALQEIFSLGNWRQQSLISMAKLPEFGGFLYHAVSRRSSLFSRKFIDGGLLILSKFPIVEVDYHIYSAGHQIDSWCEKQVLYAKIQVAPGRFIGLFTTHMQATYNDSNAIDQALSDHARMKQVEELAEFVVSKKMDSLSAVIIAGDLNINSKERLRYSCLMEKLNSIIIGAPKTSMSAKDLSTCNFNCAGDTSPGFYLGSVIELLKEDSADQHPTTYADVEPDNMFVPRETVLTERVDWCTQESLDYLFFVDTQTNHCMLGKEEKKNSRGIIQRRPGSTRVEEFFVEKERNLPFTQISDHYGVSTVLTVIPTFQETFGMCNPIL